MAQDSSAWLRESAATQSVNRSIALVVLLFVAIICGIMALADFGLGIQSSVRAYVGAEGLWSKAEKEAVYHLHRYLTARDEEDFKRFREDLAVPLGDRKARLELEKPDVNLKAATAGFRLGRNHPGDVEGMALLFRRFRRVSYLDRAIAIWEQADARIGELDDLGARVHASVGAGTLTDGVRRAYEQELERINVRVSALEDSFSATLGQASRWFRGLFLESLLTITVLLLAVALVVSSRVGTFLRRHAEALLVSERRYRLLFQRNLAGLYRTTLDGRILECNSAFARILGYPSPAELLMKSAWELYMDPADRETSLKRLQQQRILINQELRLKRQDGSPVWALSSESLLEEEPGSPPVIEGGLIDITDRKHAEEQNRFQAYHDALTGLPNRALFNDRLAIAMLHARRRRQKLAVVVLDIDHFKRLNDTFGRAAGDKLLVKVAERLRLSVREDDTVARLGGDEFIVLLSGISHESDAATMARKVLASLSEPFIVRDHEVLLTASIGLGLYPGDGADPNTLATNADAAMYRAKEMGRNNFQFSTPLMQSQSQERAVMESGLRGALPRNELVVHYQPIFELETWRVVGVEALVRWKHPEKGLLFPKEFIPLAEDAGLIVPVGEWVLRRACEQAKAWQVKGCTDLKVSVNLSARQFQHRELTKTLKEILEETGLDPSCLELEVTESIAMHNLAMTEQVLREFATMGIQIAIDDFGIGHSSLSYLKHFPIHRLKIDQSFVAGMALEGKDRAIVATIISIARNLGLHVTAEGVETDEQVAILAELRCDDIQGYLFGRPAPAEDMERRLLADARMHTQTWSTG